MQPQAIKNNIIKCNLSIFSAGCLPSDSVCALLQGKPDYLVTVTDISGFVAVS